jgi:hypothetical protein
LVIFLAVLSIAFDFGSCVYPSRGHPYFTSGRLLSAAAVPFFLLYSYTLDRAFPGVPRIVLFSGIVLFILISEFSLSWPAFSSRHNFFHLASLPLPPKNVVSPVGALPVSHGCVFR